MSDDHHSQKALDPEVCLGPFAILLEEVEHCNDM